jgi:transcriptional regulator with XRE-family HTH domain
MNADFTHETLRETLKDRGMYDNVLEGVLGVSQQTVSHIMNNNRKLTPSDQKVLKMEFFDERPSKIKHES